MTTNLEYEIKKVLSKNKNFKKILDQSKKILRIGYFNNTQHPKSVYTVDEIASINNYGDPLNNIPSRPFFSDAVNQIKNSKIKIKDISSIQSIYADEFETLVKGNIKNSIGKYEDNAPLTIKIKSKNHPLVDSEYLLNYKLDRRWA